MRGPGYLDQITPPVQEKGEIVSHFTQVVLPKLKDHTIRPVIYETFPLEAVAEAHRIMEENRHFGKIVLKV